MHHLLLNLIHGVTAEFVAAEIPIPTGWKFEHKDVIPVIFHRQILPALSNAPDTQRYICLGHQPWLPNSTKQFGLIPSTILLYHFIDTGVGKSLPTSLIYLYLSYYMSMFVSLSDTGTKRCCGCSTPQMLSPHPPPLVPCLRWWRYGCQIAEKWTSYYLSIHILSWNKALILIIFIQKTFYMQIIKSMAQLHILKHAHFREKKYSQKYIRPNTET